MAVVLLETGERTHVSTLDERRSKKRRKSAEEKAAAAPSETTAKAEATEPQPAEPPPRRVPEKEPVIDSINFAAYLRHAVSQAPEQRALLVAQRGIAGDAGWASVTVRELDERSDALARGFAAASWARGQRVLVLSDPSIDAITCVLALLKLGAVPVIIEPGRSREDIVACAEQARASVVLTSPSGLLKRFLARGPFKDAKTTVLIGAELPVPLPGVKALASFRNGDASKYPLAATRPAEPAMIMFTSGASATGRSVVLDHATLIAQAESLRRSQGLNAGEVVLCDDLLLSILLLVIGKTAVMPGVAGTSTKTVEKLLSAIDQHGITTVIGAPPQWRAVAEHCTRIGRMLPNVRQVLLAGGPAGLITMGSVQAVLPSGECRAIYSTTEAFPLASITAREALTESRATTECGGGLCLGRVIPGVEVVVLDFGHAGGTPVESGELGEICIKGARVAPSEARAAGPWTRTGDIGWMDRQGRLWIVGSMRRTAQTRFDPIYNTAAEALFEMHPRVKTAVIVPLGQPGQQEAVLVVQPADGRAPKDDPDRMELERELLHAAESNKVTRGIRRVVFKKDIPYDARFGAQSLVRQLASAIQGGHGA